MPTLAGAWRKWLVFILDLGKSTQSSWSISTSTAGAYARNNKIIRNRGSHMWFLIQWLELSAAVPCHQESTMDACIGGTIIVETLRATHGQVIVLARCFQTCNFVLACSIKFDSSTHQLPPSPQLHKPHLWRCPGFWKVPWSSGPGGLTAAVTTHWFPSTEENQASSLVGWDIPIASIPTAKVDGTAVEGILKRPVPFQKITTWVF